MYSSDPAHDPSKWPLSFGVGEKDLAHAIRAVVPPLQNRKMLHPLGGGMNCRSRECRNRFRHSRFHRLRFRVRFDAELDRTPEAAIRKKEQAHRLRTVLFCGGL